MSALVSIIIPVYNLEDYIGNCLEKLLCQTYKNLEIICVDDGSTDSSAERIKCFAESDSRIIYIYQENAGVSAARNRGLEAATGEYVMFVDGDDYLHYQAVEIFLNCIENTEYDMVCAHYCATNILKADMLPITTYKCTLAHYKDLFLVSNGNEIGKSAWAKIFRRTVALTARFPVGISNGEDTNYIIKVLSHSVVGIVDQSLYYYYLRPNSCVRSAAFSKSTFDGTLAFEDLCEYLKCSQESFLKSYCLQYLYQTIFYNRTMLIGTDAEKFVMLESEKIGKKWLPFFLKNKGIAFKIKIVFLVFFYFHSVYELARMIQDPTMKEFYKSRKADRKD